MKKMKNILSTPIAGFICIFALSIFTNTAVFAARFNGGVENGVQQVKGQDVPTTLFGVSGIFTQVVNIMLFMVGVLSVIMLISGGIRYIISNGESKAVEGAKNTILYAIVGLIVAILAYAIVNFVISIFMTNGVGGGAGTNGINPTNV